VKPRANTWHVTEHALDRYIERFEPELNRLDARAKLEEAMGSAQKQREGMARGEQRWLVRDLGIIAIVKPACPNRVVVSVIPCDNEREDPQDELMRELALEYAERLRTR